MYFLFFFEILVDNVIATLSLCLAVMAQSSSSVVIRFVCTGCTAASELMQKAFKVRCLKSYIVYYACF